MIRNLAKVHDELDYLKDDINNLLGNLEPVMGKDNSKAIMSVKECEKDSSYIPSTLISNLEMIFIKISDSRGVIREILNRIEC